MDQISKATKRKASEHSSVPLAQQAYSAVRDAIDNGKLGPGDRLSEYQVADWLNMSRTPAREALRRLEAEGLLFQSPRRGLVVVTIDEEEMRQLYEAREIVETSLAELAANNASGPEIHAIMRMAELEPSLIDDHGRMYQHNREFHDLIYRAAHNTYLAKACVSLHDVIAADSRGSNLGDPERRQDVIREHQALAKAIAERLAADAREAAAIHIRGAYRARMRARQSRLLELPVERGRAQAGGGATDALS